MTLRFTCRVVCNKVKPIKFCHFEKISMTLRLIGHKRIWRGQQETHLRKYNGCISATNASFIKKEKMVQ